MQEDFLHYIWEYKKFNASKLQTTLGQPIEILTTGQHNLHAGPDFFNARIRIDGQLWAGNVEIHKNSSDWYWHGHETDKAYDSVILHVVWNDDAEIFRPNNTPIPTLELKRFVPAPLLESYEQMFLSHSKWIYCESDFTILEPTKMMSWLERLFVERLERKSLQVAQLLKASQNDWEAVLFQMLAKNFGLNLNGEAFFQMAKSIPFKIVRKLQGDVFLLEALFFGQAQLLKHPIEEGYYLQLQEEHKYLRHKFKIDAVSEVAVQFFRLRPPNFPTIRLAQLAAVYHAFSNVFSKLMSMPTLEGYYEALRVQPSKFWETHYTFKKTTPAKRKPLTKKFIDLLLVNTIVPLKFSYLKFQKENPSEVIFELIQKIAPENNGIVTKFTELKAPVFSAMESQALIQLKREYCEKNKCLQCAVGSALLNRNM